MNTARLQSKVERQRQQLIKVQADNLELNRLFELQHSRTVEADALWQKAHNRPLVLPDLGDLIGWLLNRYDIAESQRAILERRVKHLERAK